MDIKNKKQKVFRSVFAFISCAILVTAPILATKNVIAASNVPQATDTIKFADIAAYAKVINIKSFLGKPIKIPIPSNNPDKLPGGDNDYVYIFPPQFYKNKKTGKFVSLPIKTIYFASGKKISKEQQIAVQQDLENYINYSFRNQDEVLNDLKETLKKQFDQKKKQSFLDDVLRIFNIVRTDFSEEGIAHAEDNTNTNIDVDELLNTVTDTTTDATDSTITDEDIQTLLDSDDPQMKQMLMLLLLNLLLSQKMADASNLDKETCLENGGEWIDEECVIDEEDEDDDSDKEATCTDSGGEWKSFASSRSLCLSRCGKTDSKCEGSALSEFEEAEDIIINSGDTSDINGCKCPEGQCANADNECIDDETQSGDDDEDGVENGQDKCAKSSPDGSGTVNMNSASGFMGCTCTQIQAMGGFQQQATCPAGGCNGPYYTTYISQPGSCNNGSVTQAQCVADNSGASNPTMAKQCNDQYQQQQEQKKQEEQQKQQALQDLMKKLMGGDQKGGQQGGGDKGGGDKGQGQGQGQGDCKNCKNENGDPAGLQKLREEAAAKAEAEKQAAQKVAEQKAIEEAAKPYEAETKALEEAKTQQEYINKAIDGGADPNLSNKELAEIGKSASEKEFSDSMKNWDEGIRDPANGGGSRDATAFENSRGDSTGGPTSSGQDGTSAGSGVQLGDGSGNWPAPVTESGQNMNPLAGQGTDVKPYTQNEIDMFNSTEPGTNPAGSDTGFFPADSAGNAIGGADSVWDNPSYTEAGGWGGYENPAGFDPTTAPGGNPVPASEPASPIGGTNPAGSDTGFFPADSAGNAIGGAGDASSSFIEQMMKDAGALEQALKDVDTSQDPEGKEKTPNAEGAGGAAEGAAGASEGTAP